MEFQLTLSELATISILTFIFLILICDKIKPKSSNPKLPPGPWRLPLIGHMHHLIGCLPHQKMRDLALKHGPVMHLQLGELPNIIISSREAAEHVLKTHDIIFAQRPLMSLAKSISYDYKDITFSPYGDYYRQLRKIVTVELLAAKRVLSFRSIREEETSKLVELISSVKLGSVIDFSKMITSLTYRITSRAAFGRVFEGENVLVTCIENLLFELGRGISIADAYPSIEWLQVFSRTKSRVDKLQQQLDQAFQLILDQHRSARLEATQENSADKEHLVDVLLNLQEKGNLHFPLTDDTIKAIISDTFSAGVDTSFTTMEWAMSELMKNPQVMEKVQGEVREKCNAKGRVDEVDLVNMDYLKNVVKETFRLHPAVPLLVPRECKESCVIDDYYIPVKSRVMINTWAMGRDSKYWKDPADFEPERFVNSSIDFRGNNFEFLPFGSGRRSCPGMLFGLANIEFPLAKLLYHFNWKLIDGIKPQNLDMSEEIGITTKRKFSLHIIPTPYFPSMYTN